MTYPLPTSLQRERDEVNYTRTSILNMEESSLSVNHTTTDEQWAVEELAQVKLRDARLNRRCQELVVTLGQRPNAPFNQACEEWPDTKAAHRFFDNEKVTPIGILAPHHQCTVERMTKHPMCIGSA